MSEEINLAAERLFPEDLVPIDPFEEWCDSIRAEVQPEAAHLVWQLENCLEDAKPDCKLKCDPRSSCWERFGGDGNQLIKSEASIRSKLVRDLLDEEKNNQTTITRLTVDDVRERILAFGDLGRVRLVGDFPADVLCLQEKLLVSNRLLGEYACPKGVKDFVYDFTKRNGLKGHRARQFSVRVPLEGTTTFGFEVQLMTRLQQAWDRRNHPFYEWQREHPDWEQEQDVVKLAVNDFACAETLHLVDQQADRNWTDLKEFIKKEHA